MKYFGYLPNDFVNGEGISVSFWTAGCPHKCPGCHNQHMWNYEDGFKYKKKSEKAILNAISDNGVLRNFSVLGGEPLAPYNLRLTKRIIKKVRKKYGNKTRIFLWTGYLAQDLITRKNKKIQYILYNIDVLIDGPYIKELRDVTLPLRGSSNQHIYRIDINDLKGYLCLNEK